VLICHCRAVNDATIRNAIHAGAREPTEVSLACGAGSRCGGCLPALRLLLDELDSEADRRRETSAA
jgi:bacterioferritin-associated ferredoxin